MDSDLRVAQLLLLLKSEPDDSFLQYALALEYHKKGNLSEAIVILENLLQKDSTYLGAYYQLGKLYEEQNEGQKAVNIYQKGALLAKQLNNRKVLSELNEALQNIEE